MTKSREQYIIELGQKVFDTNLINPSVLNITSRRINYWIDKKLMPFTERQEVSTKRRSMIESPSVNGCDSALPSLYGRIL
jgi:hypothetical protein